MTGGTSPREISCIPVWSSASNIFRGCIMSVLKTIRMTTALLVFAAVLAINGCSTYQADAPVMQAGQVPANEDSADFLDRASQLEIVDVDNALHGFFLLTDGEDTCSNFQSRLAKGIREGLVPSGWDPSGSQPLTKGELAYMAYKACGVKEKGVVLSLFGPSRRYCLRELQYRGMMAQGGTSMRVTGMELVAVITRADTYKRTGLFPNDVGQPE